MNHSADGGAYPSDYLCRDLAEYLKAVIPDLTADQLNNWFKISPPSKEAEGWNQLANQISDEVNSGQASRYIEKHNPQFTVNDLKLLVCFLRSLGNLP